MQNILLQMYTLFLFKRHAVIRLSRILTWMNMPVQSSSMDEIEKLAQVKILH